MSFESFEVEINPIIHIDSYSVRIQCGSTVDDAAFPADRQAAVANLRDLLGRPNDILGKKKPGREFRIITRRPHRDRDRAMLELAVLRYPKSYFERLFDGERVGRHGPV